MRAWPCLTPWLEIRGTGLATITVRLEVRDAAFASLEIKSEAGPGGMDILDMCFEGRGTNLGTNGSPNHSTVWMPTLRFINQRRTGLRHGLPPRPPQPPHARRRLQ